VCGLERTLFEHRSKIYITAKSAAQKVRWEKRTTERMLRRRAANSVTWSARFKECAVNSVSQKARFKNSTLGTLFNARSFICIKFDVSRMRNLEKQEFRCTKLSVF